MVHGSEKTRIYTAFVSRGFGGAGAAPRSFTTNEDLLHMLQSECPGVEFIGRDITSSDMSLDEVYRELESRKAGLDGVLIVGTSRDYRLAFTGLPTIVVYNLFEWMLIPYKLYATGKEENSILVGGPDYDDGKILTAQLDRRNVCVLSKSRAMFDDLVYKIKLIEATKQLKESRILLVAPQHFLAEVDYQGDRFKHLPENYNDRYTQALRDSLGVELVRVDPVEFYRAYEETDREAAEQIADDWIDGAEAVTAAPSEIVRTARAYLAFEGLRERYDCNAVSTHMRTLTGSGKIEDLFWPGLAVECGFKLRGIQAVCQNYPNVLVTQLLGYFLTGRPSMLGDIMIDTHNSVDILTHCGAPVNPYGDERRVPYRIMTHAESPVRNTQNPGSSTGLDVAWPVDESVTIWKVYAMNRKIGLHTGRLVDGHALYENLDDIMCRSKIVVKVDNVAMVQRHQSPDEYGIHRVATLGDLRESLKDLAVLTGFDVIEEDV